MRMFFSDFKPRNFYSRFIKRRKNNLELNSIRVKDLKFASHIPVDTNCGNVDFDISLLRSALVGEGLKSGERSVTRRNHHLCIDIDIFGINGAGETMIDVHISIVATFGYGTMHWLCLLLRYGQAQDLLYKRVEKDLISYNENGFSDIINFIARQAISHCNIHYSNIDRFAICGFDLELKT